MKKLTAIAAFIALFAIMACSGGASQEKEAKASLIKKEAPANKEPADPMESKGIGPVKELILSESIDENLVKEGMALFEKNCTACHKPDKKYIGPSPAGIMERRSPEWIMNMILNPTEMVEKDPVAKQLLAESNGAIMANQNLTEDEARKILEYFRTLK